MNSPARDVGSSAASSVPSPAPGPYLIISGHDYRTKRKVHLHHYAQELARRDTTRFFSVGFSALTRFTGNARLAIADRAGRVEAVDGVDCYLWRTLLHPVNVHNPLLDRALSPLFAAYARNLPAVFFDWVRSSRFVLIESGLPVMLLRAAAAANPHARFVYFASDDLAAIGCGDFVLRELDRTIGQYEKAFALSRLLARGFRSRVPSYYMPYGFDPDPSENSASPFGPGRHAVSAGQSLFDPGFFEAAAPAFPDVVFHVIGAGGAAARLCAPNIRIYDEMPVAEVVRYFRHADFGIAPYWGDRVAPYLVESSQKLTQLAYLGTPAVCPHIAVGGTNGRFGYTPGDRASIVAAVAAALREPRPAPCPAPTWSEVVDRLLCPERFPDAEV